MNAPVVGSPIMDGLHLQGKEQCLDCCVLLGYSRYNRDNDSEEYDRSTERESPKTSLAERQDQALAHADSDI